jgi:hypothetical protein
MEKTKIEETEIAVMNYNEQFFSLHPFVLASV